MSNAAEIISRAVAHGIEALENQVDNLTDSLVARLEDIKALEKRIEDLEAEKRDRNAELDHVRGKLEAAKTKAQLGAEELDLLEAALALDRHASSYFKEGISPSAQSISLELDALHAAAVAFRNTGRSL
jgi:chromosome segregation ATPase